VNRHESDIPTIAVVHDAGAAVGVRDVLMAARGVYEIIFVFRSRIAESNPDLVRLTSAVASTAVIAEDSDFATQISRRGLLGVTTFHDAEVEFANAIATELGLPSAPTLPDAWDKFRQQQILRKAGVTSRAVAAVESPADLRSAVSKLGLPGVLKPRRGVSGRGVTFLRHDADVQAECRHRNSWQNSVFEQLIPAGMHPSGVAWLADYVSVDTVSDAASNHHHVVILDKFPLSRIPQSAAAAAYATQETGDVCPSIIPESVAAEVESRVSAALDALKIRSRVSHTEVRIGGGAPEIIEVNGRMGGEVAGLVRAMKGPDIVRAALDVAAGAKPDLGASWASGFRALLHAPFTEREGLVRSDVTISAIRSIPGVAAVSGVAQHGARRADSSFHTSNIAVNGDDHDNLRRHVSQVLTQVGVLFSADGMHTDPWLLDLRARLGNNIHDVDGKGTRS
jgi:hypothetical protein